MGLAEPTKGGDLT